MGEGGGYDPSFHLIYYRLYNYVRKNGQKTQNPLPKKIVKVMRNYYSESTLVEQPGGVVEGGVSVPDDGLPTGEEEAVEGPEQALEFPPRGVEAAPEPSSPHDDPPFS